MGREIQNANLKPCDHKLTREENSRGGKKSAEVRKERRDIKKICEFLLSETYKITDEETGKVKEMSGAEAMVTKMLKKAIDGDTKAFELIRDSAGQKPVEKIMVAEVEQDVIDEVEAAVLEDD